jgi:uncharacterized Tic20 family protein
MNADEPQAGTPDEVHVRHEAPRNEPADVHVRADAAPDPRAWDARAVDLGSGVYPHNSTECTEAVICHVGGYLTSVLLPLIQMLVRKDRAPFVVHHAREALNFQITLIFLYLASTMLVFVAGLLWRNIISDVPLLVIAVLTWGGMAVVLGIWETILVALASVAAYRGRLYEYPLCIRLVR